MAILTNIITVCPFGLEQPLPIYLDVSLRQFDAVLPAASAVHSAVRLTPELMAEVTGGTWTGVCECSFDQLNDSTDRLYVSRGLGTSVAKVRFASRPELAVFDMEP